MSDPKQETEQARFWRGEFGDAYTQRNASGADVLRARTALWAPVLRCMTPAPASILEVGANIGDNLRALRALSGAEFFALEPNETARRRLAGDGTVAPANAIDGVASSIPLGDSSVDMAFTCGVLIHIHPDDLLASCREIHRVARRYVACIEYFSDQPEEVPYRGHSERLFKRDFGGFWLDHFPGLQVLGYGFSWQRLAGLDNLTWWVFRK